MGRALAADREEPLMSMCARGGSAASRSLPPNPSLNTNTRRLASSLGLDSLAALESWA